MYVYISYLSTYLSLVNKPLPICEYICLPFYPSVWGLSAVYLSTVPVSLPIYHTVFTVYLFLESSYTQGKHYRPSCNRFNRSLRTLGIRLFASKRRLASKSCRPSISIPDFLTPLCPCLPDIYALIWAQNYNKQMALIDHTGAR